MRRLTRPAIALLITLVLGVLLVGGCGLRTPGGIRVDQRSVDTAADDPDIVKLPPGPARGDAPAEIVSGFLEAAAADPEHIIAQDFLVPGTTWNDRDSATVYDPNSVPAPKVTVKGSQASVELTVSGLGQVASEGAFLPYARLLKATYQLRRVDGQWRLTRVPPGVLLTPRDLARGYRSVRTYNFNARRTLLVSEPGYVVSDRAGLAGAALHALLTNWGGEGRTSVDPFRGLAPGLTALGSVVVRDGEATVDLGREAFNVPMRQRPLLVSQIAASLGSVPGVFTVRVLVEERQYVGGPVAATIPAALTPESSGPSLGLSPAGSLTRLTVDSDQTSTTTVRWTVAGTAKGVPPRGAAQGWLFDPVAAPGGGRVAAIRIVGGDQQLVLARLTGAGELTAVEDKPIALKPPASTHYEAPQWLDPDRLLLASSTAGKTSVQLVDATSGKVRDVSAPGLSALGPLSAFVVSLDRSRVIVVAGHPGARVAYLGRVADLPAGPGAPSQLIVDGWAPIPTAMTDVDAVGWSGDLLITVVGHPAGTPATAAGQSVRRGETVTLDTVADPTPLPALPADFSVPTNVSTATSTVPDPVTVTTATDRPTSIGLGARTWLLRASGWSLLPAKSAASQLSYP